MFDVNFSALSTELIYYMIDEYKGMALSCEEPRFLIKAKAVEALVGQRDAVMVEAA